jgi:lysophospholipase L1-like esterase
LSARNALATAALAGSGLVLGFILAEAGARAFLPPVPTARLAGRREVHDVGSSGLPGNADDLGLAIQTRNGKRLLPNRDVYIDNNPICRCRTRVTTNSLGYRNPELGPKRGRRALFLGDSITMGDYLEEADTFVRLVESEAAARGWPVQTINAGVPGIGLADELAILLESGLDTEPDVVVLCFYLNDVQPSPGIRFTGLPGLAGRSRLLTTLARSFSLLEYRLQGPSGRGTTPETLGEWREQVSARFGPTGDPFVPFIAANVDDWGAAWADGAWLQMAPLFETIKQVTDRHGARLLIVGFPVRGQVETSSPSLVHRYPQVKLEEAADALGVQVLDLLPLLRGVFEEEGEAPFHDHCHPTAWGNRLIARWILDSLGSADLPPSGPAVPAARAAGGPGRTRLR